MKKITFALIILGLVFTGCAMQKDNTAPSEDINVDEISADVAAIDSALDSDLAELDALDQELADLNALDLG